jgi:hypothetical protein
MDAAVFRTIIARPDLASMAKQWDKVRHELGFRHREIGALMDQATAQVLAFAWPTAVLDRPISCHFTPADRVGGAVDVQRRWSGCWLPRRLWQARLLRPRTVGRRG